MPSWFTKTLRSTFNEISEKIQEVSHQMQEEYNATFSDISDILKPVSDRIFVMDFPDKIKAERLANKLNEDHPQAFLIFNMSEKQYDTSLFGGEVVDVEFRGLPAPPLYLLVSLVMSARQWLASNDAHVLVVHCFKGYTRSAVFLACYFMHATTLFGSFKEAMKHLCTKLRIPLSSIVSSQWRYLDYFEHCLSGEAEQQTLRFCRVSIHGIAEFKNLQLEVWNKGILALSLEEKEDQRDGDSVVFEVRDRPSFCDDVLVRLRREIEGRPVTIFRFVFNVAFVQNSFLHLSQKELDIAGHMPQDSFVDVFFDTLCSDLTDEMEVQRQMFSRARSSKIVETLNFDNRPTLNDEDFEEELFALQKEIGVTRDSRVDDERASYQDTSLEAMFDDFGDNTAKGAERDSKSVAIAVMIGTPSSTYMVSDPPSPMAQLPPTVAATTFVPPAPIGVGGAHTSPSPPASGSTLVPVKASPSIPAANQKPRIYGTVTTPTQGSSAPEGEVQQKGHSTNTPVQRDNASSARPSATMRDPVLYAGQGNVATNGFADLLNLDPSSPPEGASTVQTSSPPEGASTVQTSPPPLAALTVQTSPPPPIGPGGHASPSPPTSVQPDLASTKVPVKASSSIPAAVIQPLLEGGQASPVAPTAARPSSSVSPPTQSLPSAPIAPAQPSSPITTPAMTTQASTSSSIPSKPAQPPAPASVAAKPSPLTPAPTPSLPSASISSQPPAPASVVAKPAPPPPAPTQSLPSASISAQPPDPVSVAAKPSLPPPAGEEQSPTKPLTPIKVERRKTEDIDDLDDFFDSLETTL